MAYGPARDEAVARSTALALRAMAESLEHGEPGADLDGIAFRAT